MNTSLAQLKKRFEAHCVNIEQATDIVVNESPDVIKARVDRALKDYNYFATQYFPHYTTDAATGVTTACGKFQIDAAKAILKDSNIFAVLEWAREHAKSVHADIIIPMWLKAHGELDGMLLVGKSENDAIRLLSDIQAELESNQRYIQDFGAQKGFGTWEEGEFITKDGVAFIALGRGQSPRGVRNRAKRPNYCVIDDIDDDEIIHNPKRTGKVVKWILGALYGALSIKRSRVVMAGNRIHRNSILAQVVGNVDGKPKRKGIYHSKVNALDANGNPAWPEKYTTDELLRKMNVMGYAIAQTEYFNNPITEGTIFKNDWIRWKKMLPLNQYDALVVYCDPSFKSSATSDHKAVKFWGKKGTELHLIKAFVRQCSISTMVKWWYDLHESIPENVIVDYYIEANFIQDRLLEDFENEGNLRGYQLPIRGDYRSKPDKFSRIKAMQPLYERGFIFYNIAEKDSMDMLKGKEQLLAIEDGSSTADDSPDADEGAIFILNKIGRIQGHEVRTGERKHRNSF